jgi:hypothetical protein
MNIEKAKEIHSSVLWEQVCLEIDSRLKALESRLRTCTVSELERLQLEIQVWEKVKRLPQDVIEREE